MSTPESNPLDELHGWGKPGQSRNWHYFYEGRSLCNQWLFTGRLVEEPDFDDAPRQPDDCAVCHAKLKTWREMK